MPESAAEFTSHDATYNETVAEINHAYEKELPEFAHERTINQEANTYAEGVLTKNEPKTYRTTEERANKGGILQSGIFGRERGEVGENYAGKRHTNAERLKGQNERTERNERKAGEAKEGSLAKAKRESLGRYEKSVQTLPPPPPPAPATPAQQYPGASAVVAAAFPGGEPEHIAYVKAAAHGYSYEQFKQLWDAGQPIVVGEAPQRREKGGPVAEGQPYVVGEHGTEVFVPTHSGLILPHGVKLKSGTPVAPTPVGRGQKAHSKFMKAKAKR